MTLLAADDERFRPVQVAVGADGALYVLDRRSPDRRPPARPGGSTASPGRATAPRPPSPTKPNHWKRIFAATNEQLVFQFLAGPDRLEADRAQRELIDRGPAARASCVGYAGNAGAPLHARLLGIQGARQFWNDEVEATMIGLLDDPEPDVRRLAAQAWPGSRRRPAPARPQAPGPPRRPRRPGASARSPWRSAATPSPAPGSRPRCCSAGSTPTPRPTRRSRTPSSAPWSGWARPGSRRSPWRSGPAAGPSARRPSPCSRPSGRAAAAEQLTGLVKIPDLTATERLALIRQFPDFPPEIPVPDPGAGRVAGQARRGRSPP